MKKIVLLAIIGCVTAVAVFAQSYTVQTVTGRVELEKSGNRVVVKAGDSLSAETVIHTGIGASLVLKDGEKTLTIGAARNGKLAELAAGASGGVRVGGNIAETDTGAVSRSSASLATGSARASDAAAGEDISAE
ncbi:MAG: hypothetical protein LBH44_12535 [Treponema sp.]|nr:hypothetical protein [Treponema sp.]